MQLANDLWCQAQIGGIILHKWQNIESCPSKKAVFPEGKSLNRRVFMEGDHCTSYSTDWLTAYLFRKGFVCSAGHYKCSPGRDCHLHVKSGAQFFASTNCSKPIQDTAKSVSGPILFTSETHHSSEGQGFNYGKWHQVWLRATPWGSYGLLRNQIWVTFVAGVSQLFQWQELQLRLETSRDWQPGIFALVTRPYHQECLGDEHLFSKMGQQHNLFCLQGHVSWACSLAGQQFALLLSYQRAKTATFSHLMETQL